jgi:hypothetical protein
MKKGSLGSSDQQTQSVTSSIDGDLQLRLKKIALKAMRILEKMDGPGGLGKRQNNIIEVPTISLEH